MSEITTEIDFFQFTQNIPEKSEGISIACGTITRRTAHFSANGSHEKEEGPAQSGRKEKRSHRKKKSSAGMIKPPPLTKKYKSLNPSLKNSQMLSKQLRSFVPESEEGLPAPTFAVPYPTERKKSY